MDKTKKLIVVGASAIAEIAYEYFTYDSPYEVVAFSVDQAYLDKETLFGLPIVPFETLEKHFAPAEHSFFAATNYSSKNAVRTRFYREGKEKGFSAASYISSRAFVWRNCQIGEHCFIFEDNTVQPFVKIGNNVILWSGNHVGHHSQISDNVFVSSHVVISGFCTIGESCFMGVNSTLANNISVGNNCIIGAGALIVGNVPDNQTVVGLWKNRTPTS